MPDKTRTRGRSKPCAVCRRWFTPHARTRHCQKTCGREECRRENTRRQEAAWRRENPGCMAGYRLRRQAKRPKDQHGCLRRPPVRQPPAELRQIPAKFVQMSLGVEAYVIILDLVRLINKMQQMSMHSQPRTTADEAHGHGVQFAKMAFDRTVRGP